MTHDAREGVPNETKRKETMLPKWFLTYSIVTLQAVSKVGDAFGPALATTRPLLLLALNSNDLHVALTSALIPTKEMSGYAWFLVALARRLLEDPLFFSFGWAYREDALRFLKEKAPRVAVSSSSAESNVGDFRLWRCSELDYRLPSEDFADWLSAPKCSRHVGAACRHPWPQRCFRPSWPLLRALCTIINGAVGLCCDCGADPCTLR